VYNAALSMINGHAKMSTGVTTGTQSSKKYNPSVPSFKNSPKASLGETRSPPSRDHKLKKVEIA